MPIILELRLCASSTASTTDNELYTLPVIIHQLSLHSPSRASDPQHKQHTLPLLLIFSPRAPTTSSNHKLKLIFHPASGARDPNTHTHALRTRETRLLVRLLR